MNKKRNLKNKGLKRRKRYKLMPRQKIKGCRQGLKRVIALAVNAMATVFIILSLVGYQQNLTKKLENLEAKLSKIDLENLENNIKTEIEASIQYRDDAISLANTSLNQIVCSDTNRYNNEAKKSFELFSTTYDSLNSKIEEYKTEYKKAKKLVKEINELKEKLNDENKKGLKNFLHTIEETLENLSNSRDTTKALVDSAQVNADRLFNEYYPYSLKVVTCECGSPYCPDLDQFLVLKVVENRIKSKRYPNTIAEVIFQKGQYACTWDGSWETKIPDERTKENVRKYLRGEVDTGAPDNLLYQAMFVQGPIYTHVSNPVDGGHYYCLG